MSCAETLDHVDADDKGRILTRNNMIGAQLGDLSI
jgi:hypothetical protein